MIIGIDGNEANNKFRVGVGQFAFNILRSLYKIDNKNNYYIYLKSAPLADLPPSRPQWSYIYFGPQILWTKFALPIKLLIQQKKLDLFYSPGHYTPYFSPCPTIPTIHDLGYLQYPNQFTKKDYHQLVNWTKDSLFKASHIMAVSQFTKNEITRIYHIKPEKITITPNGVSPIPLISNIENKKVLKKFNINSPYFLYLGTLKPNKNIPFIIDGFSLFLSDHPDFNLVIAGKKGWLFSEIFEKTKSLKLESRIIYTDYIDENEKWILYQNSISALLPSIYEGFGIPALEAMKAKTPIITSKIPALEEVIGNSNLSIDISNPKYLADKMENILNPLNRQKAVSLGSKRVLNYTWENSAKSVLEGFSLALGL